MRTKLKRKIKAFLQKDQLFDGDEQLFKEVIQSCNIYGESTKWVASSSQVAKLMCVDTSSHWVKSVGSKLAAISQSKDITIKHIDLGDVGDWGRPRSYSHEKEFFRYTDWIWNQKEMPDTVLIDGRFRVCCFLTSLKYANAGTRIIFDDYTNRPHYHIIEKFVEKHSSCGRQALFIAPNDHMIDFTTIDEYITCFRYVMD